MYNKLFGKIVFSSIWLEPMPTRIVWIAFLATMDEDGFVQCSAIGNVAAMANVSLEEAHRAVETLQSPDLESGNPNHEGRRIERVPGGFVVLNAKEHRDAVTREIAKQQNRERVRKYRQKKTDVTPCNAHVMVECEMVMPSEVLSEAESDTETDTLSDSETEIRRREYSEEFETFWSIYPKQRRTRKKEAYRKWKQALKRADAKLLIRRATDYANSEQGRSEYAVMPSVWLNGAMWEDEAEAWSRQGGNQTKKEIAW